jgi:ABC transport system ATP-binding/permease protein
MSEEILKALMQLFAIIIKQDEGASAKERFFVESFLKQQLNAEMVLFYLSLYDNFLKDGSENVDEDKKRKKLTSVKDSVKTLSICKKINKTLTQKQKIIVLIRLLELVGSEKSEADALSQRKEIVNTVATVFNISNEEFLDIELFCESNDFNNFLSNRNFLLVSSFLQGNLHQAKIIQTEIDGALAILNIASEDMYFLRYLGKSSILLNGLPISKDKVTLFAYGSIIKLPIGEPIYYSDINGQFLSSNDIAKLSFEAENINYLFSNGLYGLRNIFISEGGGKLIAIMGGSGAGKTTLLNVLAGLVSPSNGTIKINGLDIHLHKKNVEGVVGYVAQDDILFEELTVYQNLFFNAKLCFKEFSDTQLDEAVTKTLRSLGLYEIKEVKVGNILNKKISGGQRKRLNIALELIREPVILFLDEPTSGLSSRDSENVVDLLKELTLKGKLIFVVIHQPSSDIYKMFDKVTILDTGGYQIYYGNPIQAVSYFKKLTNQINAEEGQCHYCGNVNPEQVFNTIDAKIVDEYGNATETRKISPKIWNDYFYEYNKLEKVDSVLDSPPKTLSLPNKITQFLVFIKRDVLSKLSNTQYLLINLLEAPVLALVLSFIIRYIDDPQGQTYYFGLNENIPAYLFMSIIVALFMGLTVSAEEIIRDAKILKREKFLNLSRLSYIFSKICILFTLSAIQTFLFVIIGNLILEVHDMNFAYWLIMFSLSCTANLIGLNISATFNSAVTIYILIPIILIPQMILSGAVFSFDKLNKLISNKEKVPIIADFMASRWAYEAIAVKQFKDNKFEKVFYPLEKKESELDYRIAYWVPKITNKIEHCKSLIGKTDRTSVDRLNNGMKLIYDELLFALQQNKSVNIDKEEFVNNFQKPTLVSIDYTKTLIEILKNNYVAKYNAVNQQRDAVVSKFMLSEQRATLYTQTKKMYYNESLADLVKKQTYKNKITEEDGRFIQIKDPIFNSPTVTSNIFDYRTHLYAPEKRWLGFQLDTYIFNALVIWIMTILLTLALYFETLKKLLNTGIRISQFFRKLSKTNS